MHALMPDVEAALVAWLAVHPDLAPLHGGRVGTELQAEPTCLQVTSLGGAQPWPWESTPEFALYSWGGEKADASLLDRTVRSKAWELSGTAIDGGRITGISVRLAALWTPDEQTGRARYRTDLALTASPE